MQCLLWYGNRRRDLSEELEYVQCPTLIVVGEKSPYLQEGRLMYSLMDRRRTSWCEVRQEDSFAGKLDSLTAVLG